MVICMCHHDVVGGIDASVLYCWAVVGKVVAAHVHGKRTQGSRQLKIAAAVAEQVCLPSVVSARCEAEYQATSVLGPVAT